MGMIHIRTHGSFPDRVANFGAMERGHAHAVAEAIEYLASEVLPAAIESDHRLHEAGIKPDSGGFDRGERTTA